MMPSGGPVTLPVNLHFPQEVLQEIPKQSRKNFYSQTFSFFTLFPVSFRNTMNLFINNNSSYAYKQRS